MIKNFFRKGLVFAVVTAFLLTSFSSVYAEFRLSESKSVYFDDVETIEIDNENAMVRKSLMDRYNSYKEYSNHPYTDYNFLRKPTFVDGEHWDIIVPDDYPTIQEAVDNAGRGSRILVRAGVYFENVVIDVQSLTLHGEDRDNTIIDAGGNNNVIRVTSEADGMNISGFTLRNSGNAGLNVSSHYNLIQDNIITNCDDGIQLYLSSGNQIQNNQIMNNQGDGLWLHHSNGNNFIDNTIKENDDNGIEFTSSSLGTTVEGNTILDNVNCGLLLSESSLGNTIIGNDISGNDFGVKCIEVSDGNTFHHNNFINNDMNAFDSSFDLWDDDIGEGNYWDDYTGEDDDGDGIGDTPYPISGGDNQDRYPLMNPALIKEKPLIREAITKTNSYSNDDKPVIKDCSTSDDWDIIVPDDYPTIQEAVDHADDGYRIFVRSDVYYENIVIDKPYLTLHGENKDTTVIDGDGNPAHIVSIMAPGVNVSGFTIRNTGEEYAGIQIYADGNTFQDNIITDCDFGIKLFWYDDNIVEGNTLTDNKFGIAVWKSKTNNIMSNYIVENNEDGVVLLEESTVELKQNNIENNTFNGVLMIGCSNAIIKENNLQFNGWFGLQMFSSNDNIVKENQIKSNSNDGISIHKSTNNIFRNNIVTDNNNGFSFWYYSNDNHIDKNEVRSNYLCGIFFILSSCNIISGDTITNNAAHGISLWFFSNNNHIDNNNIDNHYYGIELSSTSNNNNINNNTITNNGMGMWLQESSYNKINSNTIINPNGYGLFLLVSCNNSINSNTITNHFEGIDLLESNFNSINGNTITYGILHGIFLGISSNNIISGNIIANNTGYGINLVVYSISNIIYHNNFIDNLLNAYDESNNRWDNVYPYGGNYWDDYTGEDNNGDGIGDTPYPIPGDDNQDRYPLMEPWSGENNPPEPPTIKGQTSGKPGTEYEYVFSTTDPEGDIVWYWIDWDDNSVEEWIGPHYQDEEVTISHTWEEKGIYTIRCKAKDVFGEESDWGELTVTMPRNKIAHTTLSLRLLERFPLRFIEWLLHLPFFKMCFRGKNII